MLVRDLLRMPELRLRLTVGEQWLDRPVTRLYGTELPNPARYLAGGELVVSGLLWYRSAADCETFAAALAEGGAAGLAASTPVVGKLPEALVEACRRHRIPLLEVPVDLSFALITERVVLELAAERVGDAGAQLGRHRRLLTVVAGGGGLDELLAAGSAELGAACRVLSTTGHVVAGPALPGPALPGAAPSGAALPGAGPSGAVPSDAAALVREFLQADRLPKVARRTTLLPVAERGGSRLATWILAVEGDRAHDEVAAELASLVGVERARVVQGRRIENRAAGPLLRELLSGTGDLTARTAAVGWDADTALRVLVASASDGRVDALAALVAEVLAPVTPHALVGAVDGEVYAVAPSAAIAPTAMGVSSAADGSSPAGGSLAGGSPPVGWAEPVRAALRAVEPGLGGTRVLVGISSPVAATGLRGAAEEAAHARRLGERRAGRTCVVAGEEIALHQLLLAGVPEELRGSLRRRVLGPVLDYDAEHGTDLVGTLRVFLDRSGSWTAAAGQLHVHVNTLRYRMGRVEDLLGVDLADFTVRVDLYLALQAG
ncbi:PucR family transcriptional regulator ligand-binding domain-containing protein [Actinosynnema sp. NPDC047251]|uniref:Transcriptional regulator, PucR family n=1 Tax=Saccharothrix espanaensis (strain ATCC 51144 / DSM 44229 / JCM 9112 / NBRC 15066 / NRRL 15764) TaxID=1179773 RepID=K0JW91_SACES|nr:PucR family transcriptional regulator [Saccharothrix espanaensis]CCH30311.1 Transcriptional regulator, PucR family [Saccharothrix espanaensis DSM 44229]